MFDGPTVRSGAKVELAVVLHGSKSTRTRVLMSSVDNSMHGKNMKAGRGVGRGDDGSTGATVVALKMSEKSIVAGVVAIGIQRGLPAAYSCARAAQSLSLEPLLIPHRYLVCGGGGGGVVWVRVYKSVPHKKRICICICARINTHSFTFLHAYNMWNNNNNF